MWQFKYTASYTHRKVVGTVSRIGRLSVKVGDLVKQVSWDGIGVITKILPYNAFFVCFSDGEYRLDGDMMEVISESR